MKFKLSKESVKQLRGIVSNEANEFVQEQAEEVISFESNPMEYILNKYPSLTDTLDDLLTNYFRDYVTGIFVIAPKPTTFKILLHNGQMFFLTYGPKSWIAKVAGKRYYLLNLNEEESAIQAIAHLLELGRPPGVEGPDETTSGESSNKEEKPEETPEETPEEAPEEITESKKKLSFRIVEAGEKFERQEIGLVKAIKKSPKKPAVLVIGNKTIFGIKDANKEETTTSSGKEPMTDVYLETTKNRINLSLKGPSAPSLAGGGVKGIETVSPNLITDFFKKAKSALSREYKKGENIPDVYMPLDKKTAEALIKSNKESGGPIDFVYKGPMDVKVEYKGNQIIIPDAVLLTPSEMAAKYPLYLRYRKRREDQRFDSNSPSLLTQSKKGDKNGRLVVTDQLPSTAFVVKEEITKGKVGIRIIEAKPTTFEDFLESKELKKETKNKVLENLDESLRKLIMDNLSNNVTDVINFLNSNRKIIENTFDIKEGDMGRGEVTLIIASLDGQKVKKDLGDVNIGGKAYEVKEANSKNPIRAGGTYRSPVITLTTTLWLLKDDIFESKDKEQWKKLLGDDLFNRWQEFGKAVKGDKNNKLVNWTSLNKKQLPDLKSFLEALREKFVEISLSKESEPEIVVGDKALDINPEDIAKIKTTDINQNISLTGKVIPASTDYEDINRFRGIIKLLLSKDIFKPGGSGGDLDREIKEAFIKELDGGLIMVSPEKFEFFNTDKFIENFDFIGITQGNRPQFLYKPNNKLK